MKVLITGGLGVNQAANAIRAAAGEDAPAGFIKAAIAP